MTNVMHKFLIYLSIYFCLTCFGLSFTPSSEAGAQHRQWFKSPGYGVSARALTPYPADFNPRKYSWHSLLLETESTPGP
jgi:preprotein translocase subunit SecG